MNYTEEDTALVAAEQHLYQLQTALIRDLAALHVQQIQDRKRDIDIAAKRVRELKSMSKRRSEKSVQKSKRK